MHNARGATHRVDKVQRLCGVDNRRPQLVHEASCRPYESAPSSARNVVAPDFNQAGGTVREKHYAPQMLNMFTSWLAINEPSCPHGDGPDNGASDSTCRCYVPSQHFSANAPADLSIKTDPETSGDGKASHFDDTVIHLT